MKRKLFTIVSLLLAIIMVMPVGVLANSLESGSEVKSNSADSAVYEAIGITSDTNTIYYGGEKETANLNLSGIPDDAAIQSVSWVSSDPSAVSVSGTGTEATATAVGSIEEDVTITAVYTYKSGDSSVTGSAAVVITVKVYEVTYIEASLSDSTKAYNVGDPILASDLVVKVKSNENSILTATTKFDYNPKYADSTKKITVTAGGKSTDVSIPVSENYEIKDHVSSIQITTPANNTTYKVGEKLYTSDIKIEVTDDKNNKYSINYSDYASDITLSGITFSGGSYTFSSTDVGNKTLTAEFGGKSSTVTLKVTKSDSTTTEYTVTMGTAPTKKSYKVGDTFNSTGMTIKSVTYKDSDGNTVTDNTIKVTYSSYTIKDTDVGNTYINLTVYLYRDNVQIGTATLKVTGLTINKKATTLDIYSIVKFELEEDKYPVGYEFSEDDISRIYYKESKNGSSKYISSLYFDSYTNFDDIELLVLNSKGKEKTKNENEIESDDVLKDSNNKEYVTVRLVVLDEDGDEVECDQDVYVGDSGVKYYYDGRKNSDLVTIYDDIFEALEYTVDQDDDIDTDDFDLDDVDDDEELILVLGEDQETKSTNYYKNNTVVLCHNVVIDLNGHSLAFPTDFINITKTNKKYTLTITNTSSTAGTFTYTDENVTLTLNEDDKIKFEYEKDAPGIYTVTVSAGTGGTVKASPTADKNNEIKIGQGSEIKFTITPSTGYALDAIKADSKAVASTSYTTASSGVVTYTLKNVTKDQKVEITFKKSGTTSTSSEWSNPFNDVSKTDDYYSAVQFVYEHELFKGVSDTRFSPDATMTRAMFVTVLGRLAGADVTRYTTSSYSDVPINSTTSWYAPYVEWATQNGIIEGYGDGKFGPDNNVTHQQMYLMMLRYTKFIENIAVNTTGVTTNASDSADIADWAVDACKFASQKNFLVKVNNKITPKAEAKRSELAQLLEKYCDTVLEWNKETGN